MVICGICHEDDLLEVGELDCCDHSFCFPCISRWAEIESRCPFCKARFTTITHKLLGKADPAAARQDQNDGQGSQDKILQVLPVPERNQKVDADGAEYYGSSDDEDPMDVVTCMECGSGDDESHLLLCDGCENACHTYCAGLAEIPEEAWYCAACAGNATPEDPLPLRRSLRHRASAQPSPAAPRRRDRDADERRHDTPGSVRSTEGQATRRRRAPTVSDVAVTSPIDLTLSASPEAPRSRRRRLQRMGGGPVGRRRGPTEAGSTADLLDALHARATNCSAHEPPSTAHRNVENMRRNWDALRQGQMNFEPASASHSNTSGEPAVENDRESLADGEEAAWQALEEMRKAQLAAREVERSRSRRQVESSTAPAAWGSDIRAVIAQAREVGRLLGPSGRMTQRQGRPSLRSRTGPLPLSRQPSGPSTDQFKAAAKAATHMLYRREGAAAHGARPALGEVLADMDLPRAAKAVLQNA
ncbi:hypothetical protein WJX75_002842 [Coccomyxa subellipsoidea]|uniref:PHD-type domain-containing protein n=1 Tax=Coccomyxa subellipsoidea TaxID=248742 RepID=A0ABR2YXG1_9CHLO